MSPTRQFGGHSYGAYQTPKAQWPERTGWVAFVVVALGWAFERGALSYGDPLSTGPIEPDPHEGAPSDGLLAKTRLDFEASAAKLMLWAHRQDDAGHKAERYLQSSLDSINREVIEGGLRGWAKSSLAADSDPESREQVRTHLLTVIDHLLRTCATLGVPTHDLATKYPCTCGSCPDKGQVAPWRSETHEKR